MIKQITYCTTLLFLFVFGLQTVSGQNYEINEDIISWYDTDDNRLGLITDLFGGGFLRLNDSNIRGNVIISGDIESSDESHGQVYVQGDSQGDIFGDGDFIELLGLQNDVYGEDWFIGIYDNFGGFPVPTHDDTYLAFNYEGGLVSQIDEVGNYTQISDERLKENINILNPVIPSLRNIITANYNFKSSDNKQIGFLAQNLKEYFPELVSHYKTKDNDQYMVNYSGMVPVLTKAIQEQQNIIDQQNQKINEQQILIDQILERLSDLEK